MNQKHCRGCPHVDFNEMSDEMYCELNDYELIRLRWHKQRPDWCPLVTGRQKREPMGDTISRQVAIDALSTPRGILYPIRTVEELPSVQPEIIRCKDCLNREICRTTTIWAVAPDDDWFCADAERRIDG